MLSELLFLHCFSYFSINNNLQIFVIDESRISPKVQAKMEGQDGYFKCKSYSPVTWLFNGGFLPYNAVPERGNTLKIQNIKRDNSGQYECQGKTHNNNPFSAKAKLKIIGK